MLVLGSGSGIVGIAAAGAGARVVIAADTDPYAIAATGLNAVVNCVTIQPFLGDLTAEGPPDVDIVLVGDLFYDCDIAVRVTEYLDRCLVSDVEVLIGDPWCASLPTPGSDCWLTQAQTFRTSNRLERRIMLSFLLSPLPQAKEVVGKLWLVSDASTHWQTETCAPYLQESCLRVNATRNRKLDGKCR